MTIAAFFLNRRFPDQSFLQTLLRGLLGGGLFLLVLSVLFLAGGTSAFGQTKKHYLGGGLAVIPFSAEITGIWDDPQFLPVSASGDDSTAGISLSYIRAVNQNFWIAPSLSLGSGEVEYEDSEEEGDVSYSSLDLHFLYKSPSPFFIGGGLSYIAHEQKLSPELFGPGEDGTIEASGVAPSFRIGFLFADLGPGALMLDVVSRGEVSSDFEETDNEDDTLEGEISVTSYQISVSYLFHF